MKKTDIENLEWIYNRMIHVHGENKDFDYMIKFRSILNEMNLEEQNLNEPQKPQLSIGAVNGSLPPLQTILEMFYDFLYERDIAKQIGVGIDTVVNHFIYEKLSGKDH